MIVARSLFQAEYGRGDELVQLIKEGQAMWPPGRNARLLTDLSGQFFTVLGRRRADCCTNPKLSGG